MKKLTMLAVAAIVAFGFASCAKESSGEQKEKTGLSVKLNGSASTAMRSIEAPGVDQTVATVGEKQDGFYAFIYVVSPSGVATAYELVKDEAESPEGQFLGEVAVNSTVYVVANVPEAQADAFSNYSTLDAVKAAESSITTQGDYTTVALANRDGVAQPVVDPDGDGESLVNVNLSPLISRLELVQVHGVTVDDVDSPNDGAQITSFNVDAVYVDKFYKNFRWDGQGTDVYQMGTTPNYGDVLEFGMGDEQTVSSSQNATAAPGAGVWAYNVASGGLPVLIVRISNVLINNDATSTVMLDGQAAPVRAIDQTFYLTVTGYTGMGGETVFGRGTIYSVGTIDFDADDLKYLRPNPTDVELTVAISVDPWRVKGIGAVI